MQTCFRTNMKNSIPEKLLKKENFKPKMYEKKSLQNKQTQAGKVYKKLVSDEDVCSLPFGWIH